MGLEYYSGPVSRLDAALRAITLPSVVVFFVHRDWLGWLKAPAGLYAGDAVAVFWL